jgi:hypothetical protein
MAGPDRFISQPASSVTLNGSVYDANNDAAVISWTQESGPAAAVFDNASVGGPVASGLVPGVYVFRMTATAGGKSDFDEVSVTVTTPNIALGKPVSASSVQGPATPATAVNDGSLTTRWSSAYTDVEWIRIDLQAVYDLTGARISGRRQQQKISRSRFQPMMHPGQLSIQQLMVTAEQMASHLPPAARYIRMYAGDRLTEYGYSIYEFEVFGTLQTGIEDISDTGSISVYPNPSSGGTVTLDFRGSHADEEVSITVTDMSGEILGTRMIRVSSEGKAVFLLPGGAGLKPGIYIVTVAGERMASHNKLVIR